MIKVFVDTQSNRLFRGSPMEQDYDQRGGLCQASKDDIVVTTNPIDPDYLEYWKGLGFPLPYLIVAGPFDHRFTLSELILNKPDIMSEIQNLVDGDQARLEFFCIESTETLLSERLGIPGYCNFDFSIGLSRKIAFKRVCESISLPTPFWLYYKDRCKLLKQVREMLNGGNTFLLKANDGTGGISCGAAVKVEKEEDLGLINNLLGADSTVELFAEEIVDAVEEIAIHWEIDEIGNIEVIGVFGQISDNFSYAGALYPANSASSTIGLIIGQLNDKLGPYLVKSGAKGYFCCDIMIDKQGAPFWIDFNPRKGAILYIWDMARRLTERQFSSSSFKFWHKHVRVPGDQFRSFKSISQQLGDLFAPSKNKPFVVITNPAVINHGYVDITGISLASENEAKNVFQEAIKRINS
ncbi:MAG: hypothetical protein ABIE43_01755 [Patescibacteria group bacterium]